MKGQFLNKMCDFCHEPLSKFGTYYDGATRYGPWALMCPKCFKAEGVGLGVGRGQQYRSDDDMQIAGGSGRYAKRRYD